MYTRWQGWLAAIGVTAVTVGMVLVELADLGVRRWWLGHALTTDTVAGLLVVPITVLVVDQVSRRRQIQDRSRAVAAQAAIMVEQASRTTRAVSAALRAPASTTPSSGSAWRRLRCSSNSIARSASSPATPNPSESLPVGRACGGDPGPRVWVDAD